MYELDMPSEDRALESREVVCTRIENAGADMRERLGILP